MTFLKWRCLLQSFSSTVQTATEKFTRIEPVVNQSISLEMLRKAEKNFNPRNIGSIPRFSSCVKCFIYKCGNSILSAFYNTVVIISSHYQSITLELNPGLSNLWIVRGPCTMWPANEENKVPIIKVFFNCT
uniref:Peptidase A1 domain-containing protein n=1 Tax=Cacopsylla melanoneura TaxID=428564 RepID=A0A8D8ZEB4_9HEMI